VEIVTHVTASIKSQGKFDPATLELELDAAEMTLDGETARWMISKQIKTTSKGDIYGRQWDVSRYEGILDSVMEREYHKNLIYLAMKQGLTSIEDISNRIGLDLQLISHLVSDLEKTGRVKFTGMTERIPAFAAI
jgi:predicted Rossmann fold nucleotide-binding protein DprA/Smf involved in DNA uptake